jgi:flagellar hook-associated protein 2
VQLSSTEFALQVTSKTTGTASKFGLSGAGTYTVPTMGQDAELKVGESLTDAYTVTSATNTFSGLMPGATITVGKEETTTPVTLTVSADPAAVAAKVQTLVDAVNSAVSTVAQYTDNSKDSKESLRGDFSINQMAGQLLNAVAYAVDNRSVKPFGLELSDDGKSIKFDKATFLTALEDDPTLAKSIVGGVAAGPGTDLATGTADDVLANGVAGRLLDVSKAASDSATGTLVKLAAGQESLGKDIQARIEAWDLRLAKRREMLTRQFGAMETALSSLRNQSTWLAGQINSLPSYG